MGSMKKLRRFVEYAWQPTVLYAISLVVIGSLLFFRLGTLVSPFSAPEHVAIENSRSIKRIARNPVNAPHKVGQYALQAAGKRGPLAMRGVSALMGILAVYLFFIVARFWFAPRMALLGTVLFASSSWFLHTARIATPHILLAVGFLALVASGILLRYSRDRSRALLVSAIVASVCLYIPGMIWFVFIFLLSQMRVIAKELRHTPAFTIMLAAIGSVLLIAPLIVAAISQPGILSALTGMPEQFGTWSEMGKNLLTVPVRLFMRGPADPAIWLGRVPVLDIFSAAMFALGMYRLYFQRRLDRTLLLIATAIIGSLLVSFNEFINLTILLPAIYIVIMTGFSLMLQQWFTVFPRNPLARGIGLTLLTMSVLLAVGYNSSRYFIAWPHTPATKQAYTHQP
jgi:hypothetical protein